MKRPILTELVKLLQDTYGSAYHAWGTSTEEAEGTGFTIDGIPVYFSVLSFGDIPSDGFDVQITSDLPVPASLEFDQYLHEATCTVTTFLRLIESYRAPIEQWPM